MKNFRKFIGPGFLVAVGYMDPGNWATDIAGGAKYGYTLVSVIFISNIFAIFLQHAAVRLGVATSYDLAQACRAYFHPKINFILWILCEIAIVSMDLAEVLGSAIALKLLFGIPMTWGVLITALDVFLILLFFDKYTKWLEIIVGILIGVVLICFMVELYYSKPIFIEIIKGFIPNFSIIMDPDMRWIAIGILGATVMPHNLYLHSSLVKEKVKNNSIQDAIKYSTIDSTLSLIIAFVINASILILAAATFFSHQLYQIVAIEDAYKMLNPLLGIGFAGVLFAIALLASGQNATITGTLAGQIVMEGFLNIQLKPWVRRLITRSLAIVPAWVVLFFYGETHTMDLLVWSQVILSLQLGFAVVPLVYFTSKKSIMGSYTNPLWLKTILIVITGLVLFFNAIMVLSFVN